MREGKAFPVEFAIRLELEANSPIARILDAAWYATEMPSRELLIGLFEDYVQAARLGDFPAFSRDTLRYLQDGKVTSIPVDLTNGQFMGAALSKAPFSYGYEPDILACIAHFLPKHGVFYDVGANWGYFTYHLLLDPAFNGSVVAFEPVARSMADFLRLARETKLESRITPVQMALGECVDVVHISSDAWSGNQSIATGPQTGELVKVIPLDSLDLPVPDFIKLDVENHEGAALAGSIRTIRANRPVIVFESWKLVERTQSERPFDILADLDYQFFVPKLSAEVGTLQLASWWRGHLTLREFTKDQRWDEADRINVLALPRDKYR